MIVAKNIFEQRSEFLPSTTDFNLYVESRYYFLKRIHQVVKENGLYDSLEVGDRAKLFQWTEQAYMMMHIYKILSNK